MSERANVQAEFTNTMPSASKLEKRIMRSVHAFDADLGVMSRRGMAHTDEMGVSNGSRAFRAVCEPVRVQQSPDKQTGVWDVELISEYERTTSGQGRVLRRIIATEVGGLGPDEIMEQVPTYAGLNREGQPGQYLSLDVMDGLLANGLTDAEREQ